MPVGDRQRLITSIISTVLNEPTGKPSFPWMTNKHGEEHTGEPYVALRTIFKVLGGDAEAHSQKKERALNCDAYFAGRYNFIFEFDEFQHFSSPRLDTFDYYPLGIRLGYDLETYRAYCKRYQVEANDFRHRRATKDFPFVGGRTAQRAYLDVVKDFLPPLHGLNPTLRIASFEVAQVTANDEEGQGIIRGILRNRLPMILAANDFAELGI